MYYARSAVHRFILIRIRTQPPVELLTRYQNASQSVAPIIIQAFCAYALAVSYIELTTNGDATRPERTHWS